MSRKQKPENLWYMRARYKYVWDKETVESYVQVIGEIVNNLIKQYDNNPKFLKHLISPNIGMFTAIETNQRKKQVVGYALYIADVRPLRDKRYTLLAEFKGYYEDAVGRGLARELWDEGIVRHRFPKKQAGEIIKLKKQRDKLVGNFMILANKSLNHHHNVNPQLRYQVLLRDDFTCQACGRIAPEVRLHVDHIKPVAWGIIRKSSQDLDDYMTLCEQCNLGKGDMSWLFTE